VAAAWARIVIAVLASAVAGAGCGGGDNQASSGSSGSAAATPTPTLPRLGGGGGGAIPQPALSSEAEKAAKQFRREIRNACRSVGTAVRVSASAASSDARKTQMAKEIEYLEALDDALDRVAKRSRERGTGELRRLLEDYRGRLRAQIVLDRRIATAEDGYSVGVGMSQNEKNREARNDIVRDAKFDDCLHAPRPR
jgi:hypothetical protein